MGLRTLVFRVLLLVLLLVGSVVLAQEATSTPDSPEDASSAEVTPEATASIDDEASCPALVTRALDLTESSCDGTFTNEACYGYTFIDASLRDQDASFVQPGDITDVLDIQTVQLSAMDVAADQWGLMVMSVDANTGEQTVITTEDVQIVLFGDTTLQDASAFVELSVDEDIVIYEEPAEDAFLVAEVQAGETLIASSRLDDNAWLRVRIIEETSVRIGWVQADSVTPVSDIEVLPILTAEEAAEPPTDLAAQYGPMQAFIFESGELDAPCAEAPNSGMLIQTPEGVASVTIWLDEVVVQLDGTGVISAQADGDLTVGVIEGTATVAANGEESTAVAGEAIDVPLDENLAASGVPSDPRDIADDEVQALPVTVLDDPVALPGTATPAGAPFPSGDAWVFGYTTEAPFICSDGSEVDSVSAGINAVITVQSDSITLSGLRFNQSTAGVYSASYADSVGNFITDTLQVVNSTTIVGERTID
ncbi:MAG: hypothetical protein AAFQ52_16060, partial [Chloroflexota bacterium]